MHRAKYAIRAAEQARPEVSQDVIPEIMISLSDQPGTHRRMGETAG
jgi:hypothetical protein